MSENDELLKFMQNAESLLSDPARAQQLQQGMAAAGQPDEPASQVVHNVQDLAINQIISDVYIVSQVQLDKISDYVAKRLAVGMNIRAMYPMIRRLVDKSLAEALEKSKRMGIRKK